MLSKIKDTILSDEFLKSAGLVSAGAVVALLLPNAAGVVLVVTALLGLRKLLV